MDLPPVGFDPNAATAGQLRKYGFPRRPDAESEPGLARAWRRAFARPNAHVRPELRPDPVMSARHRRPEGSPDGFGVSGWGGVVLGTKPASDRGQFTWVFASITVPTVSALEPGGDKQQTVAFWVGIDGYQGQGAQVLQAGIAATVVPSSQEVTYWAWTEWFTDEYGTGAQQVANFPIAPGDLISVLVCAWDERLATVTLQNRTTNLVTHVPVPSPGPDVMSEGWCVEWVVEGISDYLPDFGAVIFQDCAGGTPTHTYDLDPVPFLVDVVNAQTHETITTSYVLSPTVLVVEWRSFD